MVHYLEWTSPQVTQLSSDYQDWPDGSHADISPYFEEEQKDYYMNYYPPFVTMLDTSDATGMALRIITGDFVFNMIRE
jgi:hypothetical protein